MLGLAAAAAVLLYAVVVNGIQEVSGSTPLSSTNLLKGLAVSARPFVFEV